MALYSGVEGNDLARLVQRAAEDGRFQAACQRYAHGNGSSGAIMLCAVNAFENVFRDRDEGARRRDAIRAVLAWIASDGAPDALEAIDLTVLTDDDIEMLFRGKDGLTRLPHLGRVT